MRYYFIRYHLIFTLFLNKIIIFFYNISKGFFGITHHDLSYLCTYAVKDYNNRFHEKETART